MVVEVANRRGPRCGTVLLAGALVGLQLAANPVAAADFGGNCCADLEERIAELEATTARKANRKLSLTISGAIGQGLIFWDDGGEENIYVVTNENYRSRFAFKGKAKISNDVEAGYSLELGVRSANSRRVHQNNARFTNATDVGIDLRDSYWYLKSKSLGGVSLGNHGSATNAITEANQTQTAFFAKYADVEDHGLGMFLRSAANGGLSSIAWFRLLGDGGDQPGDGERALNIAKYESPAIAGFTASASWGEDDLWDAALRYTGEIAGLRVAAGVGYGEVLDTGVSSTVCTSRFPPGARSDTHCNQVGGSVSVLHDETGLFVNVGAGFKRDELIGKTALFSGTGVDSDQDFWALQSGIEKTFTSLGKTTIYGEYYAYEGGGNARRTIAAADPINPIPGANAAIWATELQSYGAGIAQGIDSAAMILYLTYRHYEGGLTARALNAGVANGATANADLEALDVVFGGAFIRF